MLVGKLEIKTTRICDSITGSVRPYIDVGITDTDGAVYICC